MNAKTELHIIMPGACGPLAEVATLRNNAAIDNWIKVLSRSSCYPSPLNLHDTVSALFNMDIDRDIPSAALSMLADDSYDATLHYMHADPVHLRADLDHAVLTSSIDLAISEQESELLCDALNQHFSQDGLTFFRANRNQWFVSSKNKIQLNTTALADAAGRNINPILPLGEDARYWKKILTEAQMLMHSHEVNKGRESSGQLSINSLWFHGCGDLNGTGSAAISSICSNDELFKGLAKHIKCDFLAVPDAVDVYIKYLLDNGPRTVNVLHISDLEHLINYTDVTIWLNALAEVLRLWIYPLIGMANSNNIELMIYPCNGKKYRPAKYDVLKFWKKGTLEQHISCHKSYA